MFNFLSSDETERFYLYCWKWGVVKIFHGSYQGCLLMAQMLYISITRWKLALRLFCPANIGVCEFPLIAIESSEYKGRIQQARLWTKMIQCIGSGTKGTFWIHLSFKGRLTLPLSIYLKIYILGDKLKYALSSNEVMVVIDSILQSFLQSQKIFWYFYFAWIFFQRPDIFSVYIYNLQIPYTSKSEVMLRSDSLWLYYV